MVREVDDGTGAEPGRDQMEDAALVVAGLFQPGAAKRLRHIGKKEGGNGFG